MQRKACEVHDLIASQGTRNQSIHKRPGETKTFAGNSAKISDPASAPRHQRFKSSCSVPGTAQIKLYKSRGIKRQSPNARISPFPTLFQYHSTVLRINSTFLPSKILRRRASVTALHLISTSSLCRPIYRS